MFTEIKAEAVHRLSRETDLPLAEAKEVLLLVCGDHGLAREVARLPVIARPAAARRLLGRTISGLGPAAPTRLEAWAARTPEAMRIEIAHMVRGYSSFSGGPDDLGSCSALVRQVESCAERYGLSGEDKYTMLAYFALQALASAQAHMVHLLNTTPTTLHLLADKEKPA